MPAGANSATQAANKRFISNLRFGSGHHSIQLSFVV
jgi:hypothetical protein